MSTLISALLAGLLVALGLLATFWKCPWRLRIRILSYPVSVDFGVSALLYLSHGGSFEGGLVAAFAATFMSAVLWALRLLFGYMTRNPKNGRRIYVRGVFDKSTQVLPTLTPP